MPCADRVGARLPWHASRDVSEWLPDAASSGALREPNRDPDLVDLGAVGGRILECLQRRRAGRVERDLPLERSALAAAGRSRDEVLVQLLPGLDEPKLQ